MKKNILIIASVIIILALGIAAYFLIPQNKKTENNNNNIPLYQEKDYYEVSDFKNSPVSEPEELQRIVDRLNESYVFLREGNASYNSWINIGLYKKLLGDYQGAENAWKNSVSLAANPGLAYGNLANLYFYNIKDFAKAEEYYKKAMEITPEAYTYREGLADLYKYELKDKNNLIEDIMLEGAMKDRANEIIYYSYLVEFFNGEGNSDKASEYYAKIKKIDPNWENFADDVEINQ